MTYWLTDWLTLATLSPLTPSSMKWVEYAWSKQQQHQSFNRMLRRWRDSFAPLLALTIRRDVTIKCVCLCECVGVSFPWYIVIRPLCRSNAVIINEVNYQKLWLSLGEDWGMENSSHYSYTDVVPAMCVCVCAFISYSQSHHQYATAYTIGIEIVWDKGDMVNGYERYYITTLSSPNLIHSINHSFLGTSSSIHLSLYSHS